MLYDNINKILEFSFAMEDLSFPVNNIFLEIEGNILGDTEIFHCIRNNNPEFITYPEEMIYPCLACKDYGSKIKNIDFLVPKKSFVCDPLDTVERFEIYF